jgi:predicted amidohydrolase
MRVAVCQVNSRADRSANLAVAIDLLERAAAAGADLAVLPEYVCCGRGRSRTSATSSRPARSAIMTPVGTVSAAAW